MSISNHLMITMMVAVNFFVTYKSHQQPSEGRGDVSARQLPLDLVWFFSCSDCTVQIVQCSAISSYAVQLFIQQFSLPGSLFGLGTLFVPARQELK